MPEKGQHGTQVRAQGHDVWDAEMPGGPSNLPLDEPPTSQVGWMFRDGVQALSSWPLIPL